jgi:hypothetical protein
LEEVAERRALVGMGAGAAGGSSRTASRKNRRNSMVGFRVVGFWLLPNANPAIALSYKKRYVAFVAYCSGARM